MKCDFCNQEFPAEELETVDGALHECGDVQEFNVMRWIGLRIEKVERSEKMKGAEK